MNSTAPIITPSMVNTLESHGFISDQWEFLEGDKVVCSYRGFCIGLMIPNGGILGVSFWPSTCGNGFSKPTECLEDFPGYDATDEHIDLAKAAIDAILGSEPEQLLLVEY